MRAKRKQTSHDSGFYFGGVTLAYNTPRKGQDPFKNLKNIKEMLPRKKMPIFIRCNFLRLHVSEARL